MNSFLKRLLSVFFPNRCAVCGKLADADAAVCEDCAPDKLSISDECCRCGKPGSHCVCTGAGWHFKRCVSLFLYGDKGRELIRRYKYYGRKDLAPYLAENLTKKVLSQYRTVTFDRIVPVPMTAQSLKERGYDQAGILAREMGRRMNIPVDEHLLYRAFESLPQHKLDQKQRFINAGRSYHPMEGRSVMGENILLVDDVMTSGATLEACACCLLHIGAEKVYCATPATTGRSLKLRNVL